MGLLQGSHLFVFLFLFSKLHVHVIVEAQDLQADCSGGNYTANSAYQRNLQSLLGSIPSNLGDFGFYNSPLGEAPDRVNLAALCRVDVLPEACRSCLTTASRELVQSCPMSREAAVYQNLCTLRASNHSFFGTYDAGISGWNFWEPSNVTSVEQFNDGLNRLISALRNRAVNGGPRIKAAAGNATGPDFYMIYALVQCTPDISRDDCRSCLEWATTQIAPCCSGRTGVRVYYPNCVITYSTTSFYNLTRILEVEDLATGIHPQAPPSPVPLAPPQAPPSPDPLALPQAPSSLVPRSPSRSPPPGSSLTISIIFLVLGVLMPCTFT